MIKVNNLTLYTLNKQNKTYLLNDVCFSLKKGESLGIIGKVGDGKSLLCKSLIGIYDDNVYLEKGSILIDGKQFTNNFRGKKISLVFQNPNTYLNPLMKVGKQISEMLTFHYKYDKKTAKAKTLNMMTQLGFENPSKIYSYYPYELSGGMQQKICLCIALVCDVDILILDESTSYLDDISKHEILSLIKKLQKEKGLTVIMVSHNFKEIYDMCDKIAILRKGQMIELGNKKEIILKSMHPYTIELLCDYLRYYDEIEDFTCPLMNIELKKSAPFTMISDTHYVRSWYLDPNSMKISLPKKIKEIRRKIYDTFENK